MAPGEERELTPSPSAGDPAATPPRAPDAAVPKQLIGRCCVARSADTLSSARPCQIALASSANAAATRSAGHASFPSS